MIETRMTTTSNYGFALIDCDQDPEMLFGEYVEKDKENWQKTDTVIKNVENKVEQANTETLGYKNDVEIMKNEVVAKHDEVLKKAGVIAQDKAIVEQAKTETLGYKNDVETMKNDVQQLVTDSTEDLILEGNRQVARVSTEGTTQVDLAKAEVALATQQATVATEQAGIAQRYAETAQGELSKVATEGAKQIGLAKAEVTKATQQAGIAQGHAETAQGELSKVTAEGAKQVKAVSDKGVEQVQAVATEGAKQVKLAKAEVTKAESAATLATTEADRAGTQAKAEVTKATQQATVATEQAGIATTKSEEATTQADRATREADRAGAQAQEKVNNKIGLNGVHDDTIFNFISKGDSVSGLRIGQKTYDFVSDVKKYSVRFAGSNPEGVREDDAIGMIAEVGVDNQTVRNDFDNVSFFDRPIVCGDYQSDGRFRINAYKGEPTFATDGSNGNVWRECTPFYYKGDIDNYISVTSEPLDGYKLAPGFKNGTDKVYLPVYWMSLDNNNKPASISGKYPLTGSCNSFMAEARKYNEKAHLETIDWAISDYILQTVEFATKDIQTIMMGCCNLRYNGKTDVALEAGTNVNRIIVDPSVASNYVVGQTICIGTTRNGDNVKKFTTITAIEDSGTNKAIVFDGDPVNIAIGNFISSRPYMCGITDVVVASSGSPVSNTSGKYPCIWRGKVSPWGDGLSTLSNILTKRRGDGTNEPYVYNVNYLENPTLYSNGAITEDYVEMHYNLPVTDGYVKTLGLDERYAQVRITDVVGGSSTTYHGANYYFPRNDICTPRAGGSFADGRSCSPVFFDCYGAPSGNSLLWLSRLFVYRS